MIFIYIYMRYDTDIDIDIHTDASWGEGLRFWLDCSDFDFCRLARARGKAHEGNVQAEWFDMVDQSFTSQPAPSILKGQAKNKPYGFNSPKKAPFIYFIKPQGEHYVTT